ncbi:MAG: DUF4034 domain-containing protein [Opitutales bacterium]
MKTFPGLAVFVGKTRKAGWLVLVITGLSLPGCGDDTSSQPETGVSESANKAPEPTPGVWRKATNEDFAESQHIYNRVIFPFWKSDFETLEQMAAEMRETDARNRNSSWQIDAFYDAFWDYSSWNSQDPEVWSPQMETLLQEWRKAHPDSVTPHIALAGFYVGWAWDARGGGWARDVTEEGWRLFHQRLEQAYEVLQTGPEALRDDPATWAVVLMISRGLGAPPAQAREVFAEAQATNPGYWPNYHRMAIYLLPRWHGEHHREWHEWLTQAVAASGLPAEEQDQIYAMVTLRVIHFAYDDDDEPNPFLASRVDWERLERGSEWLLAQYPDSTRLPNYFLKAAAQRGAEEAIRRTLERMQWQYDRWVWSGRDDSEFFELLESLRERFPDLAPLLGDPSK